MELNKRRLLTIFLIVAVGVIASETYSNQRIIMNMLIDTKEKEQALEAKEASKKTKKKWLSM